MSNYTELNTVRPDSDNMAVEHSLKTENDCTDRINTTAIHLHGDEGTTIVQQTVFVKSELPDEQVFENLNVKTEPALKGDEEVLEQGSEDDDNTLNIRVKKKKKKVAQVKKKKIAKDRVAAMKEKLNQEDGRKSKASKPESYYIYKTVIDESGNETQVKVEETADERRRRLTRERVRRSRMNKTELERLVALRKQRIQRQKLRLKQRLEETEEEAEARRRGNRERTRKCRQRMKEISQSTADEARNRLKSRIQKQRNRQRLKELMELDDLMEAELRMNIDLISENDAGVDSDKNSKKKRAPDDIEYLYFYESSEERRRRSGRERQAKFRANKQKKSVSERQVKFHERELLDIEEESDTMTSRRCLDFD